MTRNWLRRLRTTVAAGLLLPASFLVISVAVPGIAEARCDGSKAVTSTMTFAGDILVSETPASRTCNGNNFYDASFRSHIAGWRASVWIRNNTHWVAYLGGYNDTVTYTYSYNDDNSHSIIVLCLDDRFTGLCGWGPNFVTVSWPPTDAELRTYSGVNSGF
jgi:hypothetical protein